MRRYTTAYLQDISSTRYFMQTMTKVCSSVNNLAYPSAISIFWTSLLSVCNAGLVFEWLQSGLKKNTLLQLHLKLNIGYWILDYWREYAASHPYLTPVLKSYAEGDSANFLAFLLDPGSQAAVISLAQQHGSFLLDELCHLTRTWLFQHHRARFRALGLWEWLV